MSQSCNYWLNIIMEFWMDYYSDQMRPIKCFGRVTQILSLMNVLRDITWSEKYWENDIRLKINLGQFSLRLMKYLQLGCSKSTNLSCNSITFSKGPQVQYWGTKAICEFTAQYSQQKQQSWTFYTDSGWEMLFTNIQSF